MDWKPYLAHDPYLATTDSHVVVWSVSFIWLNETT